MGLRDFFKKKNKASDETDQTPPMTAEQKQLWWDQIEPLNVPVERRWRANEPRYPYRRKSDREALAVAEQELDTATDEQPLEPWQTFANEPNPVGAPNPVPESVPNETSFNTNNLNWTSQFSSENGPPTNPGDDWNDTGAQSHNSGPHLADGFSFSSDSNTSSDGMPWHELGLTSNATWNEVVERYRALVKTHHPDRHGSNDAEARKAAEEQMAAINAAFDDLNQIYRLTDDV